MLRLLFIIAILITPSMAGAAEDQKLFSLIDQRLAYMKDVAAYKAASHQPVEDIAQEEKVIAASKAEAGRIGLAPDSIGPFLRAQIDAAKAIQYRYRADWMSVPRENTKPIPLPVLRARIGETGDAILRQLQAVLVSQGRIRPGQRALFDRMVDEPKLTAADKKKLFEALRKVSLRKG
ncbi:chorismate mutase [Brucella endophytica]|uniref:chorismate mutase n=1 Tax=Brucella endophytica TaxID=1963359 RepID=UPI0016668F73|nr:chorismate mutase [Brucella endophytica]